MPVDSPSLLTFQLPTSIRLGSLYCSSTMSNPIFGCRITTDILLSIWMRKPSSNHWSDWKLEYIAVEWARNRRINAISALIHRLLLAALIQPRLFRLLLHSNRSTQLIPICLFWNYTAGSQFFSSQIPILSGSWEQLRLFEIDLKFIFQIEYPNFE